MRGVEPQLLWSAAGLHGAGGYRAQCGLVEGTLMFIGVYFHVMGKTENEIVSACYDFAAAFEKGIEFAYQYILEVTKQSPR